MNYSLLLEQTFFGNTIRAYLLCVGILLSGLIFKRLFATLVSKQTFRIFKKFSQDKYSEVFILLLRNPFEQLFILIVIYYAFNTLNFPTEWNLATAEIFGFRWLIEATFTIAVIVVICKLLLKTTDFVSYVFNHDEDEKINKGLVAFSKELIKAILIIIAFFAVLDFAFRVNVLALFAGLGIGGLAIALAAQDTIANLFGSFVIYLDKPFQVGDQVEVGDVKGVVESVGFRTTKVRTLDRSLLTVPNKKMVDSALNNITRSTERRVVFYLQLTYQSSSVDILKVIDEIKAILKNHPEISDEITVNFSDFDSSSLNILVIYFVKTIVYEKMIGIKETINVQILQIIEKNNCSFAYQTQTVFLEKKS